MFLVLYVYLFIFYSQETIGITKPSIMSRLDGLYSGKGDHVFYVTNSVITTFLIYLYVCLGTFDLCLRNRKSSTDTLKAYSENTLH